jgi:hypothetical protein
MELSDQIACPFAAIGSRHGKVGLLLPSHQTSNTYASFERAKAGEVASFSMLWFVRSHTMRVFASLEEANDISMLAKGGSAKRFQDRGLLDKLPLIYLRCLA